MNYYFKMVIGSLISGHRAMIKFLSGFVDSPLSKYDVPDWNTRPKDLYRDGEESE